jgi:hypothetical protein
MLRLRCPHCDASLDEVDLISNGLAGTLKPQRCVTSGMCPECRASLNANWTLDDIEAGVPSFVVEEE